MRTSPTKQDIKVHIRETLSTFLQPGVVVELRALNVDNGRGYSQTYSGYFDNLEKLVEAAISLDGKASALYIIPNPIDSALLARAANRVRAVRKEPLTSDQDIIRRLWFLIDLDAVRPAGISSTDEEHQLALAHAVKVRDFLTLQGWPLPVEGDSGNGGHLNYRIDLPNDEESRELLQKCLNALAALFDTDQVRVDPTVYNASRIWKLYGTMTKKGDNTPDRPHRRAWLLSKPENLEVVSVDLLRKLAEMTPKAELPGKKSAKSPAKARELPPEKNAPSDPEIIIRARQYLAAIPGAVAGQNGDHATYKVACVLMKDFGLSEAEAFSLFQEWNVKCSPPWEESEVINKLRHAAKYGKHELGEKSESKKTRKTKENTNQLQPITETNKKPIIKVIGGKLPEMVDQAEQALLASCEQIYQRGGLLVRVLVANSKPPRGIKRATGALLIQPVEVPCLVEKFTKAATWGKFDVRQNEWKQVDCPKIVAETYLARGTWQAPVLVGIISAPTLRPDGSILDLPGYDEKTGLLFYPENSSFSPIPQNPTREDALVALALYKHLLKDFPFVSEIDFSVQLSAYLTGLIRYSIRTAPIHGISAPLARSGKTLLADSVALVVTSRSSAVMSQANSPEEEKKRLLAILMAGDQVVCIDNIERPLASDSLCSIITQEYWQERLLGKNKMVIVPTCATWLATGNNLTFQGDLTARALMCMIAPQCERPEEREFLVNLYQYIPEHRDELVKAGLTILLAYHVTGRPKQKINPYGGFEEWSDWVRSAIVWLGLPDPCQSRTRIEAADPVRANLRALLENWHKEIKEPVTVKELVQIANTKRDEVLYDALQEIAGDRLGVIDQRKLGNRLKFLQERIENGLRLEQAGRRQGTTLWCVRGFLPTIPPKKT